MNRIRITGGSLKGRSIGVPKAGGARYTSAKVREAIFDFLGDVRGARVLDLFAGSGSLSIEALSRGSKEATCVEKDRGMAKLLRQNLEDLSLISYCDVLNMDVIYAIPFLHGKARTYDVVFVDPPYGEGFLSHSMELLKGYAIYHRNTLFILEYSKRTMLNGNTLEGWEEMRTKRYGDTLITVLKMDSDQTKE
jgi:16S rRNA (guanine966-N2)-methyltransferase